VAPRVFCEVPGLPERATAGGDLANVGTFASVDSCVLGEVAASVGEGREVRERG